MLEFLGTLKSFLASWKTALFVFLCCLVLWLIPEAYRPTVSPYLAILTALSGVGSLWHAAKAGLDFLATKKESRAFERRLADRCSTLNPGEKEVLAFCLTSGHQTVNLPLYYQPGQSLVQKGFLAKAGGAGNGLLWPHTVPDRVWNVLRREAEGLFPQDEVARLRETPGYRMIVAGQRDPLAWE